MRPSIYWEDSKKVFNYGDYVVIIDFDNNKREMYHWCGICKDYRAKVYNTHSICEGCQSEHR